MINLAGSVDLEKFRNNFKIIYVEDEQTTVSFGQEAKQLLYLLYISLPADTFRELLIEMGLDREHRTELSDKLYNIYKATTYGK